MLTIAIGILWLCIGVLILGGILMILFWAIRRAGFTIPANIESIVWAVFGILILIYLLTAIMGGGLPHPMLFR